MEDDPRSLSPTYTRSEMVAGGTLLDRRCAACVLVAILLPLVLGSACTEESGSRGSPTTSPSPTEQRSPTDEPTSGRPIRLTASDGIRIEGRAFGEGRVGVVFGHQIDGDQRDWWDLASTLADEGYTALTLDFRGYCPRDGAGCSEDGGTAEAWRDLLAGASLLRGRGADRIVFVGASMGGTAAVLAASRGDPPVDGVISLSGPTSCCGMTIGPNDIDAIDAPMLFVAGQDDADAPTSARQLARWAGNRGRVVILASGEHGIDLIGGLASPEVERRTNGLIRTFLERVARG